MFVCFLFFVMVETLGHTLVSLWAPLGTPWAPLGTPWTSFKHFRAPLGHPWCHCGRPFATSGTLWARLGLQLGTAGRPSGAPGYPFDTLWTHLGRHFYHLRNVSPKTLTKSHSWDLFFTTFRERCICDLTTPVQSKHTSGHYF